MGDVLLLHIDGASRGNPGEAGAGVVITDGGGKIHRELKRYLGRTTNNQAEYQALILALREAKDMAAGGIRIFSDSELLVRQMNGLYKIKNRDIKTYADEARELLKKFSSWEITHVPREENSEADRLANDAIDSKV